MALFGGRIGAGRRPRRLQKGRSIPAKPKSGIITEPRTAAGARTDRHSAVAACKWRLFALPVLTCKKHAALRVAEKQHFRLAIF